MKNAHDNILTVENLKTVYDHPRGMVRAVDGISFSVNAGETVCLIGESGSGKTQAVLSVLGLVDAYPGIIQGNVHYKEVNLLNELSAYVSGENGNFRKDLTGWKKKHKQNLKGIRGKEISLILQEPTTSFSPFHKIGDTISNVIKRNYPGTSKNEAREKALYWLSKVKLDGVNDVYDSYVFQLSGGMAQRAMIALALSTQPKILIADEPTTALDVTTQLEILELLSELKASNNLSLLIITHDFGIASRYADKIFVMYAGKIIETATRDQIVNGTKLHPYTIGLLEAARGKNRSFIKGNSPDPSNVPAGCAFHPRCEHKALTSDGGTNCESATPALIDIQEGHKAACWKLAEDLDSAS